MQERSNAKGSIEAFNATLRYQRERLGVDEIKKILHDLNMTKAKWNDLDSCKSPCQKRLMELRGRITGNYTTSNEKDPVEWGTHWSDTDDSECESEDSNEDGTVKQGKDTNMAGECEIGNAVAKVPEGVDTNTTEVCEAVQAIGAVLAFYADPNKIFIDITTANEEQVKQTLQIFLKADSVCPPGSRIELEQTQGGQNTCVPIAMYLSALACFTEEGSLKFEESEDDFIQKYSNLAIKMAGLGLHQYLEKVRADVEIGPQIIGIFGLACGSSFPSEANMPSEMFRPAALDLTLSQFTKYRAHTCALIICYAGHCFSMISFQGKEEIFCIDTLSSGVNKAYHQRLDGVEQAKTHWLLKAMRKVAIYRSTGTDGWHDLTMMNNSVTLQQFSSIFIKSPTTARISKQKLDEAIDDFVRRHTNTRSRAITNKKETIVKIPSPVADESHSIIGGSDTSLLVHSSLLKSRHELDNNPDGTCLPLQFICSGYPSFI